MAGHIDALRDNNNHHNLPADDGLTPRGPASHFAADEKAESGELSARERVLQRKQEKQDRDNAARLQMLAEATHANASVRAAARGKQYDQYRTSFERTGDIRPDEATEDGSGGRAEPKDDDGYDDGHDNGGGSGGGMSGGAKGEYRNDPALVEQVQAESRWEPDAMDPGEWRGQQAAAGPPHHPSLHYITPRTPASPPPTPTNTRQHQRALDELLAKLSEADQGGPRRYEVQAVADEVADLDDESDPDSDSDVDGEIASEDEGWARPEPGEGEEGDAAAEDMQVHEDELRAELEMCTQRCDEIRKTLHETRSFIKGKGPTSGAEAKGERPEVAGVVLGAARATGGDGGAAMTNDGGRGGARGGGGGGYDIATEARGAARPAAREGRVAADE